VNVALVTTELPPFPGGIGTYTGSLARLLSSAGHGVVVLYASRGPTPPLPAAGVRVVHLTNAFDELTRQGRRSFPDLAASVQEAIGFALAVREWLATHAAAEGIEVLEVPDHFGMGAVLQDVELPASVVVGHSSSAECAWYDGLERDSSDRLLDAMEFIALATADAVACHSRSYQAELAEWLGRDVLFAPAPMRRLDAPPWSSPAGSGDGVVRMVVLSRLQIAKGAEVVCQALESLGPDAGVEVDWFGKETAAGVARVDSRRYLAAKYPAVWGKSLRWHGPVPPEQVWNVARDADVVLVPSVWETYSCVASEAGALGAPLIISDGAGASYLFSDGDSACVVPSGDPAALAAAMLRMKNADLRGRLGRRARDVVTSQLEDGVVLGGRIAVYEQAVARRRLRRAKPIFRQGASALTDHLFRWAAEAADRRVVNYSSRELVSILGDRVGARVRRGLGLGPAGR
jgi:glycosyltransferase involved in cell wall biosynthesis